MTETREALITAVLEKWSRNAQRMDDYRGILMCIDDLTKIMSKPDVIPPPEIVELIVRASSELTALKGRPFFQPAEVLPLLNDLLRAVKALSAPKPICAHDFRAKMAGKSYHAICVKCTLDAGVVDLSGVTALTGVKA